MTTKAEQRYKNMVAELGCYLCQHLGYGRTPAQVHHLREGMGMAQRNSDYVIVPLCDRHHANSSPDGIHGGRKAWKRAQVGEIDALAWTLEQLNS